MNEPTLLHVAFGQSAGGSLKEALAKLGRSDRVLCGADDLGHGPINPPSAQLRLAFIRDVLCYEDYVEADVLDGFWKEVASNTLPTIVWLSTRCVSEHAGFLEYLTRVKTPPLIIASPTSSLLGETEHRVPTFPRR
jgi:hypothetical protein